MPWKVPPNKSFRLQDWRGIGEWLSFFSSTNGIFCRKKKEPIPIGKKFYGISFVILIVFLFYLFLLWKKEISKKYLKLSLKPKLFMSRSLTPRKEMTRFYSGREKHLIL